MVDSVPAPAVFNRKKTIQPSPPQRDSYLQLLKNIRGIWQMKDTPIGHHEECGTLQPPKQLAEVLSERMKIVFRRTHGAEMTQEDRDYLGIPPCAGECCP